MTLLTQGRPPIEAPELLALVRGASNVRDAKEALAEDVITARTTGFTWREIAAALGMTEHGAANLYKRTLAARGVSL